MNSIPLVEQKNESVVKIMAVDDDPQIVSLIKSAVTSFGFQCETAADGTEALAKANEEDFAIVLTDLTMPRMDGMTLLRELKNLYPRLDVIVITGYAEKFTYTDVIKAGACDFIAKPFNTDELEAKLRRALREQDLVRQLEHLSLCDALTGLHNRRGFETKLREEVHRAQRQNYSVFLAIVDMDKFKSYNDRFGHQAGDEALKSVGNLLLSHTREEVDWCCRPGGDEFAMILPYTSSEQARAVCQRILEQYRLAPFGETNLSIGLARFVRDPKQRWEDDIKRFILRADQSMYQAKKAGGSQICYDD